MNADSNIAEFLVAGLGRLRPARPQPPDAPQSVFVLRNNDIGDLLVVTPLFEALRWRYPSARLVAGVGSWSFDVLQNNPHLDAVVPVSAPWHNKYSRPRDGSRLRHAVASLRYLCFSQEVRELRRMRFDIGIDVLGSRWGALLFLRAGIPFRLGVRGYAGGHSAMSQCVAYHSAEHVGRAALRFAEMLGLKELPENRPQIFLTEGEKENGAELWRRSMAESAHPRKRVILAPGAGLPEKRWPIENYQAVVRRLAARGDVFMAVVGGPSDRADARRLAEVAPQACRNMAGELSLRAAFALAASADLVVCSSSSMMHAAAAFRIPTVVVLGPFYSSARSHAAQWGHGGSCVILGPERNAGVGLPSPDEILAPIARFLGPVQK